MPPSKSAGIHIFETAASGTTRHNKTHTCGNGSSSKCTNPVNYPSTSDEIIKFAGPLYAASQSDKRKKDIMKSFIQAWKQENGDKDPPLHLDGSLKDLSTDDTYVTKRHIPWLQDLLKLKQIPSETVFNTFPDSNTTSISSAPRKASNPSTLHPWRGSVPPSSPPRSTASHASPSPRSSSPIRPHPNYSYTHPDSSSPTPSTPRLTKPDKQYIPDLNDPTVPLPHRINALLSSPPHDPNRISFQNGALTISHGLLTPNEPSQTRRLVLFILSPEHSVTNHTTNASSPFNYRPVPKSILKQLSSQPSNWFSKSSGADPDPDVKTVLIHDWIYFSVEMRHHWDVTYCEEVDWVKFVISLDYKSTLGETVSNAQLIVGGLDFSAQFSSRPSLIGFKHSLFLNNLSLVSPPIFPQPSYLLLTGRKLFTYTLLDWVSKSSEQLRPLTSI
ncbi:hypothetical protein CVT24_010014, partial [Panaeolus cyanescens]